MNGLKRWRPTGEEETASREEKDKLTQGEVGPSFEGIFTFSDVKAIGDPKPHQNDMAFGKTVFLYAAMSVS